MRFPPMLLLAGFAPMLFSAAAQAPLIARASGRADTLGLAIAAAQWATPHLPTGRRIGLAYGLQGGRTASGLVRNADDAAKIAATFHGVAVFGDSARGCANPCAPGEFDIIVRVDGRFADDTTALAYVTVREYPGPASRRGSLYGWAVRFRYLDRRWVFDTVVSVMAS